MSLSAFLEDACATVRRIEAEGKKALFDDGNEDAYRALMRQKAEFLAGLSENAGPVLAAMDENTAAEGVAAALESFSFNAGTALRLNSVFYMSALLYPDDYKEGEPNNLERLTARCRIPEQR